MHAVRRSAGWVALLLTALAPGSIDAGSRPRVAVRFEVKSIQYKLALGADLSDFCASAERAITGKLAARERYLEFVPGETDSNLLRVALVPNEVIGGASGSRGVNLRLALFRSPTDSAVTVWPFLDQTLSIEAPHLLRDLELAFGRTDRTDLQRQLLSKVPIADSGLTLMGPVFNWVIPHTMEDLCTDRGTRLLIRVAFFDGLTNNILPLEAEVTGVVVPEAGLPPLYLGRLTARSLRLDDAVKDLLLQHPDRVHVNAVCVTDFAPMPACEGEEP